MKNIKEDNFIIEMAIATKATHIVSRDKDILELKPLYEEISIVRPEEFIKELI